MLDIPKIGVKLLEMRIEASKKFYEEITQKFEDNKDVIDKKYKKEEATEETFDSYSDSLIDDYHEQQEFENIAGMLTVSHEYFVFEDCLKSLAGYLNKQKTIDLQKDFKEANMSDIKKFFKKIGVDFDKIEGFGNCNILRLIVNCIKHNGAQASERLEKTKGSGYKKGDNIKISSNDVNKYSEDIARFYGNLVDQLNPNKRINVTDVLSSPRK